MSALTKEEVDKALDLARPELIKHGGNVQLVAVNQEGVVLVRLLGACSGCKSASATLHDVIEKALKEKLPAIKRVEAIM